MARPPEIELCQALANQEDARLVLIVTECSDVAAHRSRVEGRQRQIPNWYELDWEHVQRARNSWEPIVDADLILSATEPSTANLDRLNVFLEDIGGS